jgi:hypothetical protein
MELLVVKAIPLQALTDPGVSRRLRLPVFRQSALGGSKVVSSTHRPPLHPGSWYSFLLEAESIPTANVNEKIQ